MPSVRCRFVYPAFVPDCLVEAAALMDKNPKMYPAPGH
jgi:hypothetical protein